MTISLLNRRRRGVAQPANGTEQQDISAISRFALVRAPDGEQQISAISRFALVRAPEKEVQISAISRFAFVRQA